MPIHDARERRRFASVLLPARSGHDRESAAARPMSEMCRTSPSRVPISVRFAGKRRKSRQSAYGQLRTLTKLGKVLHFLILFNCPQDALVHTRRPP
jgi:hypothetical protein